MADPLRHFADGLASLGNPVGSPVDKVLVGVFRWAGAGVKMGGPHWEIGAEQLSVWSRSVDEVDRCSMTRAEPAEVMDQRWQARPTVFRP